MKALSIYPEPVMEIFMGDKTIEYRTWQTDYRGDLLICAGSKKEPGFVNGYAYFVVSLLDIRPEEGWDDDQRGYEWILGAPRLIRPIPVRGRLFLFDVDDAQIHYIQGGDLGTYPSWQKANEFRKAYVKKYLEPITYRPSKDTPIGGIYGSVIASEETPDPPKPAVDMPVQSLLDAILNLDPFPPTTVQTSRAHPELELGLARYPSQKDGAIKWLQGLIKRKKISGRAAYNEKLNLLCLLWLAEALGEKRAALKEAIETAMAYNTILPLEMEDVIELSGYFYKSLQEASALTQCAIAQHQATDELPSEWCTWNGGVHMASRDMSPFRVQYIRLSEEDMTHSLFGINNDMTLSQKRTSLIDQGWSQGRNEFVYVSPDDKFEMVVHENTIEASWTDDDAFAFVQSTGVTMAFDQEEYTVIGTGMDSMETLTLRFSLYGWEYLNDSFTTVYSSSDLTVENAFDDQAGSINEAYFTVQGKKGGTFNLSVQYYVAGRLYATATTRIRVVTDPSTLEHTDVSSLFGKRMDKLSEEFPTHVVSLMKFLNQSEDLASQFWVDWKYHNLNWGSRLAPNGTGGYYVDMIMIPYNDYYHSLYGIYTGMAEEDRQALLEANGWVRQSDSNAIYEYAEASYINTSLGRIIEWNEFSGIYCYMTPSAAAALSVPSGITMFAMPRQRTVTKDAERQNRAEVMVWFASKDASSATISALPNECMSGSKFTTVNLDTSLFKGGSSGSGTNTGRWMYFKLNGLGSGQITIRYTDTTYGTHDATTIPIYIVDGNSWA